MELKPISFSGGVKSISDDDLCATCGNCQYRPGEMSGCGKDWPGMEDEDGYVQQCAQFVRIAVAGYEEDLSKCPQCGGEADNGIDRCVPPSAYMCSKCCAQEDREKQAATGQQ